MRWTVERLRVAIMALAALLLLFIVGFMIYGHWQVRHTARDLPARLGIQVQQSTKGFVMSKFDSGDRTSFTLHAARAVEYKSGGRVLLHDVEIDIYNRQDGKADTIAGSEFQFDPHDQIVQAQGESHIVLQPPHGNATTRPNSKKAGKNADRVIRVTTHGLVFNQKTGVATSSGEVDFHIGDSSGEANGSEYDSKQGHLLLKSQVVLRTRMQDRPAVVHASQAIYDRGDDLLHLRQAQYASTTQEGTAGAATILLRADGSAERLDASKHVHLASADGTTVEAASMRARLNARSQPQRVRFAGSVQFMQNEPSQQTRGDAQEAVVDFDGQGRARQAVFDRKVSFDQHINDGGAPLERMLDASHLAMKFLPRKTGRAELESAVASGDAVFKSRSTGPNRNARQTQISAQVLTTSFLPGNQIREMNGTGQTRVRSIAANGDIDSSMGDTLRVMFAPGRRGPIAHPGGNPPLAASNPAVSSGNAFAVQSIRSAVQSGHVEVEQTVPAKGSVAEQISTATGARAEYQGANDTMTLTGTPESAPVFRSEQLELTATRIEVERARGVMIATGHVQTTLRPGSAPATGASNSMSGGLLGGNQPVHVIAARAISRHASQETIFSGHARLWQGGDMVEAPVIELSQKQQTLAAYGAGGCTQCVHSTLIGASQNSAAARRDSLPATKMDEKNSGPAAFTVVSGRLLYSDAEREASFLEHVEVDSSGGQTFADQAAVYLSPPGARVGGRGQGTEKNLAGDRNQSQQSSVERIVAAGHVRLIQPGRYAKGSRLVYTASDGRFVLTGDDKTPPEAEDAAQGTVTGRTLTFSSQQQAIMVSGSFGHSTTAETRIHKR